MGKYLNKVTAIFLLGWLFMPQLVFAVGNKAEEQLKYVNNLPDLGTSIAIGLSTCIGIVFIILGGLVFYRDYVKAKDDRDKKFSLPQLLGAVALGLILIAPLGIVVMVDDVLTGGESQVKKEHFEKPKTN